MQIVSNGDNLHEMSNPVFFFFFFFFWKTRNIINLSCAEFAQRVVNINMIWLPRNFEEHTATVSLVLCNNYCLWKRKWKHHNESLATNIDAWLQKTWVNSLFEEQRYKQKRLDSERSSHLTRNNSRSFQNLNSAQRSRRPARSLV